MANVHVLYGPPGTGKTTEMLNRLDQTIKRGVSKEKISYTSFTRAAANEALSRLGLKSSSKVSTLHALVYRLLKLTKDRVVDLDKLREFGEEIGIEIHGKNSDTDAEVRIGDELLSIYQFAVARGIDPVTIWSRFRPGNLALFSYFCRSYEAWKLANGFIDFNDMLSRYLLKPVDLDSDYLFIDEAQDLSILQWSVIERMLEYVQEVHVAGDDDQAIFEWSGAYPKGMYDFEQKYNANRIILSKSWRLPRSIHSVGNLLTTRIRDRVPKEFSPRSAEGDVFRHGFVRGIKFDDSDTLVLYRNHYNRRELEDALIEDGIPYTTTGGRPAPLQMRYARAARAFVELQTGTVISKTDTEILQKTLANPYKHYPMSALLTGELKWWQVLEIPHHLREYLMKVDLQAKPRVRLGTIHSAKGAEADKVILLTSMTQRTTQSMMENPDGEFRVWYVGVTRAKKELHIVEGNNGFIIP